MDAFVEMTGTGTASATPDVVALDLGVRSGGATVAVALADADAKMGQIIAAMGSAGVEDRDIQTTGASVYPQFDRDGTNVTGYVANQSLRVRVRRRAEVGSLIARCSEIAGNSLTLDNISMQLSDPSVLLRDAREEAFRNAEDKARQFAVLSGREVGPVLFVIDSPHPVGMPFGAVPMAARREALSVAGDMEVAAGENSVTASVVVRWSWL